MDAPENRDELVQEFCSFTSADPADAAPILAGHAWNVEAAVASWFDSAADQEAEMAEAEEAENDFDDDPQPIPSAGRTLGGGPTPHHAATQSGSSSSAPRAPQRGLRTLSDLRGDAEPHDHDHDDDSDQDLFAGGEKSGLAVHNPSNPQDQIQGLLDRARRNAPRPGGEEPDAAPTAFSGRGVTLGGDDAPSRVLEDPRTNAPAPAPRVRRVLHLWQDGFSVDDGALYRYDDPANADTLRMINSGRAPLDLLNVEHGQEVDLELDPQKEKKYVLPKKQYKPFSGSGQRLGSPTPGAMAGAASSTVAATTATASSSRASQPATPDMDVDTSQPTITLQIRLGDGTRLQSRFNTTHTISDIYSFVDRARPESAERAYALMTTFPSKELDDKTVVLGDVPEFKRGGVVVQKWK